jgi:hypothetical protein
MINSETCIAVIYTNTIDKICSKDSISNTCYCETHSLYINCDQDSKFNEAKHTFTTYIQNHLNQINLLPTKEQKIIVAHDMYAFICKNLWFLDKYDRFRNTVIDKLSDVERDGMDVTQYKSVIFPRYDVPNQQH